MVMLQSIYGEDAVRLWHPPKKRPPGTGTEDSIRYEVELSLLSPHEDVSIKILVSVPPFYPTSSPPQLQLLSRYVGAFSADSGLFGSILRTFISVNGVEWTPDCVCVFDGLQSVIERCTGWYEDKINAEKAGDLLRGDAREQSDRMMNPPTIEPDDRLSPDDVIPFESFTNSLPEGFDLFMAEPITDRKSVFIGPEEAVRTYGEHVPSPIPNSRNIVIKQPIGVVSILTPWNFPSAMITRKLGAALAAGCTAVIKPPPETPFSALALAELATRAGVPDGVINVVTTFKNVKEVGKEMCENKTVKKVTFTGSTPVAKLLYGMASTTLKKVSIEAGGNAPFIVFDDANIDEAVESAIICKFRGSGQTCVCANRIYVQSGIYADFASRLTERVAQFKIGNGLEEGMFVLHSTSMEDRLQLMKDALQEALDELSSTRSSSDAKSRALQRIESFIASACILKDSSEDLSNFNALQYTFECNAEKELQASKLSSQLSLSLSLIQGVCLNHDASKLFLGRKYALEVLVDLLLASRHLSTFASSSTDTPSRSGTSNPPLSSVILDTLLCILVDSPAALRVFEDINGNQSVVKILKRAGTPREVRMKCLEFLYFYLLDENPTSGEEGKQSLMMSTPPPTAPATPSKPLKSLKPSLNTRPLRPSSRLGSSEFSFPSNRTSASSTPRSTSGSSTKSFTSTSSNTSGSTAPSSVSSSPAKPSLVLPPKTPPNSPPPVHKPLQHLQPRSLMMLRKEVDYEPQSPKKVQTPRSRSGLSRHGPSKSMSTSWVASEDDCRRYSQVSGTPNHRELNKPTTENATSKHGQVERIRTTEEKKELLGTMLGNVDALVEGVRKAGIWGLG
ncbi:hypothetical protein H0H93_013202 [Arthromyces matolae]|nr:hypothetical protein H0H93_013202 [Arthromyces matolae]